MRDFGHYLLLLRDGPLCCDYFLRLTLLMVSRDRRFWERGRLASMLAKKVPPLKSRGIVAVTVPFWWVTAVCLFRSSAVTRHTVSLQLRAPASFDHILTPSLDIFLQIDCFWLVLSQPCFRCTHVRLLVPYYRTCLV